MSNQTRNQSSTSTLYTVLILGIFSLLPAQRADAQESSGAYLAYTHANRPTTASYTPSGTGTFNPLGGVTITRSGPGVYDAQFAGLGNVVQKRTSAFATVGEAGAGGHVQVTSRSGSIYCNTSGWRPSGLDVTVGVRCFDASGSPVDAAFNVLFLEPHINAGDLGFAWADQEASSAYAPDGLYAYNGAGGDIQVTHTATGFYTVTFDNMGRFADAAIPFGGGQVHVTGYGPDARRCQVSGWTKNGGDFQVFVLCRRPDGRLEDARFSLLTMWPGTLVGTHAYAWANQPSATAAYTPSSAYNEAGGVSVNRQTTGRYRVTFAGLSGSPHVQITPRQGSSATCDSPGTLPFGDLTVRVNCYDEDGRLADAEFAVSVFYGAAPVPGNTDVTVDFDGLSASTLLDHEFIPTTGVEFVRGGLTVIPCASDEAACARSRSARNVVRPVADGEFTRRSAFLFFSGGAQQEVIVSVNSALMDGQPREVTMQARNGFDVVDEITSTVGGDPRWTARLRVTAPAIEAVKITSRVPGADRDDNQFVIDDVFFNNPAPGPTDTLPPDIAFEDESRDLIRDGQVVTTTPLNVRVVASDDVGMEHVSVEVQRVSDGVSVLPRTVVCGTVATGTCGSRIGLGSPLLSVPLSAAGDYRLMGRAVDHVGKTTEHTVTVTYDPPPPLEVREAFVHKVEFNQSVTNRLYDRNVFPPEDVFIVPGKNLLIRYYLHSEDEALDDFSAQLQVTIDRADGTTFSQTLTPNAGQADVELIPLPPDTGTNRRDTLVTMRADLSRTLNFVVPGDWFEDATLAEFELWDGTDNLSTAQIHDIKENRSILALQLVHVNTPTAGDGLTRFSSDVRPYLEQALPFTEVEVLSGRTYEYDGYVGPALTGPCAQLLFTLSLAGDDFGPEGLPGGAKVWWSKLIMVDDAGEDWSLDCDGLAYLNNVNAMSRYLGMVAAHEVGHNTGLEHAGNSHGENDGGGFVPWPYFHGALGTPSRTFGAILSPTSPPSDISAGTWDAFIIDPCPTPDLTRRFAPGGCDLMNDFMSGATEHDTVPHELMSYGDNDALDGSSLSNALGLWPSNETYTHLFNRARSRPAAPSQPTTVAATRTVSLAAAKQQSETESIPVLIVSAMAGADGRVDLLPVMRRNAPRGALSGQQPGPYLVELLAADGAVLAEGSAAALQTRDGSNPKSLVQLLLPYVRGVERVRISLQGLPVAEAKASPNPPIVRVLTPNGAEHYQDGTVPIRWTGQDADGDPLRYIVQYTPDNGDQWHTIGIVNPGQETELEIDAAQLRDGRRARVRVTASDGVNTSVDGSNGYFGVGPEPPVTSFDIWKADASTGTSTRITFLDETGEFNPDWSPDGTRIVHDVTTFDKAGAVVEQDLYITDLDAETSTPLEGGTGGNDAAWHPDGSSILFDRCPFGTEPPVCEPSLYRVPARGGEPEQVRTNAVDGDWGPEGKLIVFHQPSNGSVRIRHLVSGRETVVAPSGFHPAFSPDGKHVAYASNDDLYRRRVNGAGRPLGAPVRLTRHQATDSQPSWAPKGDRMAFHSNRNGSFDLYTLSPGRAPAFLTGTNGENEFDPSWSPDGRSVGYAAFTGVLSPTQEDPIEPPTEPAGQHRLVQEKPSALTATSFPNPFNQATTIEIELPHAAFVTLTVYDLLGREVAVLIDGPRKAGGHVVQFEPDHLPSGPYFFRLQADDASVIGQMALVK